MVDEIRTIIPDPAKVPRIGYMGPHGQFVWIATDTVITEVDPFFMGVYGYQDKTDEAGPKFFVWLSIVSGGQALGHTYDKKEDALALLDRIRQAKMRH